MVDVERRAGGRRLAPDARPEAVEVRSAAGGAPSGPLTTRSAGLRGAVGVSAVGPVSRGVLVRRGRVLNAEAWLRP